MSARRIFVLAATLFGMALTGALGRWQLERAAEKQALTASEQAAEHMPPIDVTALLAASSPSQVGALVHRAVVLRGHWVGDHTIYLDNRVMGHKSGFYVLTPLQLADGGAAVLVLRGWAPRDLNDRARLPPVLNPGGTVSLHGRVIAQAPSVFALGGESPGPIRQNVELSALARETGLPLAAGLVQQSGSSSDGLERDWPPLASGADKNRSYAFQWFSLCALMGGLFLWFQVGRPLYSLWRGKQGR